MKHSSKNVREEFFFNTEYSVARTLAYAWFHPIPVGSPVSSFAPGESTRCVSTTMISSWNYVVSNYDWLGVFI